MKTVFAVLLTGISLFGQPFSARRTSAPQARVLTRTTIKDEPVDITDPMVDGKRISFGRPFAAADNWVHTLAISIKNTSSHRILYVGLELSFPRPEGSTQSVAMTDLFAVGNRLLQQRQPTVEERLSGIAPGKTATIRLSTTERDGLTRFLNDTKYPASIEKVELRLGAIIFDDDTMWYVGGHFRRDTDPSQWKRFKPPGSKGP